MLLKDMVNKMQLIELQNIPNQIFNIILNNVDYRIQLKTVQGLTLLSAWRNDEVIFYNQICTPNEYVNPYDYVSLNGKLFFESLDDEYPNYKNFGNTQRLYFFTPEEVKANEAS